MAKKRWLDEETVTTSDSNDMESALSNSVEDEKPTFDGPIPEIPIKKEPAPEISISEKSVEKSNLPSIPLKVFVAVAGPKQDQMAGFTRHAQIEKMGPRTVPEWRANYQAFLSKPMS